MRTPTPDERLRQGLLDELKAMGLAPTQMDRAAELSLNDLVPFVESLRMHPPRQLRVSTKSKSGRRLMP